MITYEQHFTFHWFPSNRGYYSNDSGILFFLKKADFLVKNFVSIFNSLKFRSLTNCRESFTKICWAVLRKTTMNFLWRIMWIPYNLLQYFAINCRDNYILFVEISLMMVNSLLGKWSPSDGYDFRIFHFEELR